MSLTQAMYAASAGAFGNQQKLDVLANNLANINTPGFKQDKLVFRVPFEKEGDSPNNFLQGPSTPIPSGARTDFSQGVLRHTDNAMDLALDGDGFFCVQTPKGTYYTRNGSFGVNGEGLLSTKDGLPVLGQGGVIQVSGSNIHVDEDGNVFVDEDQVDTLKIVTVPRPESMQKMGNALFALRGSEGAQEMTEGFKVKQGYIETSNVNSIQVMTEMIDVSRGYEAYQKMIQFLDDAAKKSVSEVGRVA